MSQIETKYDIRIYRIIQTYAYGSWPNGSKRDTVTAYSFSFSKLRTARIPRLVITHQNLGCKTDLAFLSCS